MKPGDLITGCKKGWVGIVIARRDLPQGPRWMSFWTNAETKEVCLDHEFQEYEEPCKRLQGARKRRRSVGDGQA